MIEHSAKQCQRIATPYIEKTNSHLCEQFSNDINISGLVVLCDYYNIIMIIFVMFERRKWIFMEMHAASHLHLIGFICNFILYIC